ncbi:hypothetical protein OSK62_27955, partial [Escherichia coli]|nr:hypothetical protein [Escherichia coli]
PASSLCEPACGSSAWPFSPRYRAAYRRQTACTRKRLLPKAANEVVPRRATGADAPFGLRLRGRWDTFLCLCLS